MDLYPSEIWWTSKSRYKTSVLFFFVPGNPGVLAYYLPFLQEVYAGLEQMEKAYNTRCNFFARSLSGFELSCEKRAVSFTLLEQVENAVNSLLNIVDRMRCESESPRVILLGHSLGCYLILEIIRSKLLQRERIQVHASILLCPTIMDLRESSNGKKLKWLTSVPLSTFFATCIVKGLVFCVPRRLLPSLVEWLTGMPTYAAEVTSAFLTSSQGIAQAIYMGKEELESITHDKWDESVWGSPTSDNCHPAPMTVCFWCDKDHWIATETRDNIIATRGYNQVDKENWKPRMEIDDDGIPHDFVMRHSSVMAKKVIAYVDDIMKLLA